jgi:hypothetical protein
MGDPDLDKSSCELRIRTMRSTPLPDPCRASSTPSRPGGTTPTRRARACPVRHQPGESRQGAGRGRAEPRDRSPRLGEQIALGRLVREDGDIDGEDAVHGEEGGDELHGAGVLHTTATLNRVLGALVNQMPS